jgi:hypothetical protein
LNVEYGERDKGIKSDREATKKGQRERRNRDSERA